MNRQIPVKGELPSEPGSYQIFFFLNSLQIIKVRSGKSFRCPPGIYIYTGSAMNGIRPRVSRHLRRRKRKFWHIDYLLERGRIIAVKCYPSSKIEECLRHKALLDRLKRVRQVRGFGAGDCDCSSHLLHLSVSRKRLKSGNKQLFL
jgi:Uri superfamily endonuclease